MELDPETGETRPIIESENKPVDDIPNISLDKKVEEDKINQNGIKDIPDISQPSDTISATENVTIHSKTSVIQQNSTVQIGTNVNTSTDSQPDIFVGPNPANGTDSSQNEDNSDNEESKEPEEILDKRLVEGKEPWYLIKWKDSSHESNTWEPIDKLNCPELIKTFEEKIQNQGFYK